SSLAAPAPVAIAPILTGLIERGDAAIAERGSGASMAPLLRSAARPAHLGERGQVSVTTRLRCPKARGPEGARPNPCPFVWRVPAPRGVGILADLFTGGQDLHTQGDQGAAVFLRSHAHERAGLEVLEGSLTCLLLLASIEDGLAG